MTGCQGQDWASYQDWTPPTDGLAFAAIKVTEGTSYTNPRYASQLATARSAQLVAMHYHFARPGASMQAQADFFLRKATIRSGDVLALDWEDTDVSSADKDAWIHYVQGLAPKAQVILYCNRDFWFNRDKSAFSGDGLWIADPNAPMGHPSIKAPWLIHQYSEAGGIDRDYCPLSPAELRAWAHAKETDPMATLDVEDKKWFQDAIAAAIKAATPAIAAEAAHQVAIYQWDSPTTGKPVMLGTYLAAGEKQTADILAAIKAAAPTLSDAQVKTLAAAIATNPALTTAIAAATAADLAKRLQS